MADGLLITRLHQAISASRAHAVYPSKLDGHGTSPMQMGVGATVIKVKKKSKLLKQVAK